MADVADHFDEHLPNDAAQELQRSGIDVETTPEAGLMGEPDDVHLRHAHDRSRVVVTYDDDYVRLHRVGLEHSGIVFFPRWPAPNR